MTDPKPAAKGPTGDNVVDFPAEPGEIQLYARHRPLARTCRHNKPAVHWGLRDRRAYCRDCGETLDPLEVLHRYAKQAEQRRASKRAWADLQAAWSWLWDHEGGVSISRKGGVQARAMLGGRKVTKRARAYHRESLPILIVRAISALVPWQERPEHGWVDRQAGG